MRAASGWLRGDLLRGRLERRPARSQRPPARPFEPVRCHCFITESTFGPADLPLAAAGSSCSRRSTPGGAATPKRGRASLLMAYSFGKAQRILKGVDASIGPDRRARRGRTVEPRLPRRRCGAARDAARTAKVTDKSLFRRALVVAPPSVQGAAWTRRFGELRATLFASGWMQLRGARRRRARSTAVSRAQRPCRLAGPAARHRRHRRRARDRHARLRGGVMVKWLEQQGLQAGSFATEYGDVDDEEAASPGDDAASLDMPAAPDPVDTPLKRFAELYAELDATTSTGAKVEALKRYFAAAARRATPPGPSTSWPAASRARWCRAGCCVPWPRSAPASTTGCSKRRTKPSATSPRPSPTCCRRRLMRATSAWRPGSKTACCRCAAQRRPSRAGRIAAWWDELDTAGPLPAQQADRRQLSRRREPAAGAAARAGRRAPASTPSWSPNA